MAPLSWWRKLVAKIADVPDGDFEGRVDELGDMLDRAFAQQQDGLDPEDGTRLLDDSLGDVKRWLSQPENVGNAAGHFFAAYLNGYLGYSPANLFDIARAEEKRLSIALDVPDGAVFTYGDASCALTIPGILARIYLVDSRSAPTLGMLVELGDEGMKKELVDGGMSPSKAAKTVRDAKATMKVTRVEITPVRLGNCTGKRYAYYMPTQTVHHYCLTLTGRHFLVTATAFHPSETSFTVLENAIATMRFENSR